VVLSRTSAYPVFFGEIYEAAGIRTSSATSSFTASSSMFCPSDRAAAYARPAPALRPSRLPSAPVRFVSALPENDDVIPRRLVGKEALDRGLSPVSSMTARVFPASLISAAFFSNGAGVVRHLVLQALAGPNARIRRTRRDQPQHRQGARLWHAKVLFPLLQVCDGSGA
jgi:hypothetical protein